MLTRRPDLLSALAFVIAVVTLSGFSAVARQSPAAAAGPSGAGLPEGPGKSLMVRTCGACHEPQRAASVRLTRDGWADLVQQMVQRGAKATPDEQAQIVDYLATNFLGQAPRPINVNSAPAIDLESVIGLLRKEARAVVAYREAHGLFESLDDMKQVPGLDFAKIEAAKDRIVAFPPIPIPPSVPTEAPSPATPPADSGPGK